MIEQKIVPSDFAEPSGEPGVRGRVDPRESMLLMASLRCAGDGVSVALRVRNLSSGGLMAICERRFAKGERVDVELRNIGWIGGAIAWAAGDRIGVQFDRPIDPKAARRPLTSGTIQTSTIIVAASGKRPGLR